ncbi:MAG TPA: DUF1559 domain-containing protein [Pirellulaceae bacterium]|nr:DUF1559 domain-containing protein [Pirellulaceae bacterium]HMO91249.1 DUF1559 domain-containing protein [Pirellulaceae bacterium]HMP68567.1 DUF1559 domain-containing protein [Pirellulaceae bacterium]
MYRLRHAFTLIELLVVIAVIGILASLLMPAVQSVREAVRRTDCLNHLRQLAVATSNYESGFRALPPGVYQHYFVPSPRYRGITLFVRLLPYLEQDNLVAGWDYADPINNTVGGNTAKTAAVLPILLCPSDPIDENPISTGGGRWYGLTSYGGNGGSRSYDPQFATNDGVFYVIGPGSQTAPQGTAVKIRDIRDGLSNTLLFGERSHYDPNHDTFAANIVPPSGQFLNPMARVGWWANSGGRLAAGDVTLSAYARINFRIPLPFDQGSSMVPPATDWNSYLYYNDRRMCAYGSSHGGGANFALCDGSTRFISEQISELTLNYLSIRNDNQVLDSEAFE